MRGGNLFFPPLGVGEDDSKIENISQFLRHYTVIKTCVGVWEDEK